MTRPVAKEGMMDRAMRQNTPTDLWGLHPKPAASPDAVCIGCGCSDSKACVSAITGPCWWIKLDRKLNIGVCSECPEKIDEFESRVNEAHAGEVLG